MHTDTLRLHLSQWINSVVPEIKSQKSMKSLFVKAVTCKGVPFKNSSTNHKFHESAH